MEFIGRERELALLKEHLDAVHGAVGRSRPGRCLIMRGRRRVGKSRLVEEFVRSAGVPVLYYTAGGVRLGQELEQFRKDVSLAGVPEWELLARTPLSDWDGAFHLLSQVLPGDRASIVVIDEVPYLSQGDPGFEGTLQRAWDRYFEQKPVLLVLIGSDLSVMEALTGYGRPFYQRGREMKLGPLTPGEVGRMLALPAPETFDAWLVTGGLPLICAEWKNGEGLWDFLEHTLADPTSPLLVSAERSLAAEFPKQAIAKDVLSVIGSGERTFGNISRASGGLAAATATRSLELLVAKRVVAAELPLSTRPSKDRRYRIADPYLRFWTRFLQPALPLLERGRSDVVLRRIRDGWTSWRGRAVEPVIREALSRLLPDEAFPDVVEVGSFWTRTNDVEIDIIGADREPIARRLFFAGSVKWLEDRPFDNHDLIELARAQGAVPGAGDLPMIAVSRAGVTTGGLAACYGPEDLIRAWD
ncbi:ATP-binding protein [Planomonospora parontospora]|uniref:ATP-binding protein n=1 Tax=Planomonospora parontospora TaxID=58119 RepID=UPI001EF2F72D|nr:ATP-binding protein [Planomonospora parontospora]